VFPALAVEWATGIPRCELAVCDGVDLSGRGIDDGVLIGAQGVGGWHFDSSRHHRRHSRSATFRFYYGGWWYPQPYWRVYSANRISCGEGRAIVSERFNRVRVVECSGGTYTYLGRRSGETFRVLLNARTGRIVGRVMI
jgi:hypothetical protein